jgi:hypothetical protein
MCARRPKLALECCPQVCNNPYAACCLACMRTMQQMRILPDMQAIEAAAESMNII